MQVTGSSYLYEEYYSLAMDIKAEFKGLARLTKFRLKRLYCLERTNSKNSLTEISQPCCSLVKLECNGFGNTN